MFLCKNNSNCKYLLKYIVQANDSAKTHNVLPCMALNTEHNKYTVHTK